MRRFPNALLQKLSKRAEDSALRELPAGNSLVDFSSNDYLGFAASETIFRETHQLLSDRKITANGATGSRLISGNYPLYAEAERLVASFHNGESALLFNSGYDANVGFFSAVPQRSDIILYDELCHASIRDGIRLSNARSYKFAHNDPEELELLLGKFAIEGTEIYIATESVFSMDGDSPNLETLAALAERFGAHLVVDEAHALGVFGDHGHGLVQHLNLQDRVFARIMTFGKGLGCHGAAILGSQVLSDYLVNFARSFIYTTGLPPHSIATIITAYDHLENENPAIEKLRDNILFFNEEMNRLGLKPLFVRGKSAIRSAIIPGNEKVKDIASKLFEKGFDVKAILSPTVPEGQERLRICLHSYNTKADVSGLLNTLVTCLT
jgi:8-amino-7-oxononanoate synthase